MNTYDVGRQRQCMGCMGFYSAAMDICPYCGYEDGQKAVELLHIAPGTLLADRYIIGRALGYGGFGVTYLAWDTQLKRKLAIKEYLPSEFATRMIHHQELIVANNEKKHQQYNDGMKKFLQEGQKLARVSNIDGIVHMYDCFEANNTAYITMEYLEGETLASFLDREGKIGERQAMDYILPVMEALATVHEKGIIHRDIAPDNIFLSRDASGELKVKLIDFGAAKFATTSHSKSLTVIIKPGYSPEEQYRSNGDQGTYTDVYALAAVLYRMVTGVQPPDAFERRTMIESKKRDLLEEPSKYNRELSANFENALLNAMNVRIEDRTATIAEFEEELISFEPVKRRGSSIRRIDFMRWPLWAKIGVPVGSVAAMALLIWGLIAVFTNPVTSYELPEGMTRVPDFVTADFEQAQEWAEEAVLLIGSTGTEYVPNAAENIVLRQDVYSGAVVLENTTVSVVMSTGEEHYYLPDVTGMEMEAARTALECMGLDITVVPCEQVAGLAANCVKTQDLEPYTVVKNGEAITLGVTDGGSSAAGTVCKLVGLEYQAALETAAGAGAVIRVTGRVFSESCTVPQIQSQSVAEGTVIEAGTVIDVTVEMPMRQFTMPNLLYKSRKDAKQLLKNIGIDAAEEETVSEIIAKGLVTAQSVEKEKTVTPGELVTLVISSGTKPFAMPDTAGKTEEEARRILTESALVVSVEYDYDPAVQEGNVIRQSVAVGNDVTRGTEVAIVVCSTRGLIQVMDVQGMNAAEAQTALETAGLVVMLEEAYGTDENMGQVIAQLPAAASYQKPGTTVVLTVSKGAKQSLVPNVIGMNQSEAASVLQNAGFGVEIAEVYDSGTKGKVISQDPGGETSQKDGTVITLRVSLGSDQVTGISIKSQPDKTNYFVGGKLDTSGLALKVTYKSGETKTVSKGFSCSPTKLSDAGTQTITVTYSGQTTSFKVNVEKAAVSGISIKSKPGKVNYYAGDKLDTSGLSLTVTYQNGTTKTVSSGFNCSPTKLSDAGTQTITVTYSGHTTSFKVNVEKVSVSGISIKSKPSKVSYYVGDNLDTSGLALTVTNSNGTTETVNSGFSCSPTKLSSAGTQTITVTYGGFTASFSVSVVKKETPTEAAWSDWTTSLPSGVSSDGYEIQTKTQYRSRTRETTTSSNSSMDGWKLYDTKSSWGDWGGWSDWSTSEVSANDSTKVETKRQFRYAEKIYTSSESGSLDGWTQYDSSSSWSDWGSWSSWQDGSVGASDSRQVETRTVYPYYCYICSSCGAHMPYNSNASYGVCYTDLGGCGRSGTLSSGAFSIAYFTNSWDTAKYWNYNKYYIVVNGENWFKYTDYSSKIQYRYRDRSYLTTYYYWKWDDWSGWSDTACSESDSRRVETRDMYRFCTRPVVSTYYYERYTDWSAWGDSAIAESGSVDVETRTIHRYRKK